VAALDGGGADLSQQVAPRTTTIRSIAGIASTARSACSSATIRHARTFARVTSGAPVKL